MQAKHSKRMSLFFGMIAIAVLCAGCGKKEKEIDASVALEAIGYDYEKTLASPQHEVLFQNADKTTIYHVTYHPDTTAKEAAEAFEAGAGASCHQDTQGQTQRQRDAKGCDAQLQGQGDLFGNDLVDGHADAVLVGGAQIALENLPVEVVQLLGQRIVQAQRVQLGGDLRFGQLVDVLKVTLNGHQTKQRKEDRDDDEHGDQGSEHALDDIFGHGETSCGLGIRN